MADTTTTDANYAFADAQAAHAKLRSFFERCVAAADAGLLDDAIRVGIMARMLMQITVALGANPDDSDQGFYEAQGGDWVPEDEFCKFMDCQLEERQAPKDVYGSGWALPNAVAAKAIEVGSIVKLSEFSLPAFIIGRVGRQALGVSKDGRCINYSDDWPVSLVADSTPERRTLAAGMFSRYQESLEVPVSIWGNGE
jgi:hypothetical protein